MRIDTDVMQDASEIVHYDNVGVPLYIRRNKLTDYPDMRALCHWHEDIEFIRVTAGAMNYQVNGHRVLLKKGDCIMVNAWNMHYGYDARRQECEFICFLFHPCLFPGNERLYDAYIRPVLSNQKLEFLHVKAGDSSGIKLADTLDQIMACKETAEPAYEIEVAGLVNILWSQMLRQFPLLPEDNEEDIDSELMIQKRMVSYIYEHYPEKLSLTDIAAAGNVSRNKCCAVFRHYLQQSPVDFLNGYRLEVSSHLLRSTALNVTDIALACGFNHLSYYSKQFQRKFCCTPSEYRRNNGN